MANELSFTPEQLTHFETEMRKYRVPWLYKIVFGSLYKWGKYFMPAIFLVILVLGLIHNFSRYDLFDVIKGFAFFWIFFIGGFVLISFVMQRLKVNKARKQLGLSLYQWNELAKIFQITYIK
jgi:hypothetical protein